MSCAGSRFFVGVFMEVLSLCGIDLLIAAGLVYFCAGLWMCRHGEEAGDGVRKLL